MLLSPLLLSFSCSPRKGRGPPHSPTRVSERGKGARRVALLGGMEERAPRPGVGKQIGRRKRLATARRINAPSLPIDASRCMSDSTVSGPDGRKKESGAAKCFAHVDPEFARHQTAGSPSPSLILFFSWARAANTLFLHTPPMRRHALAREGEGCVRAQGDPRLAFTRART